MTTRMQNILPALLMAAFSIAITCAPASAQEMRERLRDRIKERVQERQQERRQDKAALSAADINVPGDHDIEIVHGRLRRMASLHVPRSYSPNRPTPLVVSLHGGGGNMSIQGNDDFYNWISKSEEAGFIVVFPNGYSRLPSGKLATWNAGACCGQARDKDIGDTGFIAALVQHLSDRLNIDRDRIFANGMSNGGMMAYQLACELSDLFRAVASVAGTDNTLSCTPKIPIPILHIHARDDDLVLFGGGAGRPSPLVTDFRSVPDTIAKWVRLNSCATTPRRVLERPGAYCDAYTQCQPGAEVQLCVTEKGGHSWPGGQKPRGNGEPSRSIDATETIWAFFAKQQP